MPPALSAVPVAFLGTPAGAADERLVEIADVLLLPSIQVNIRAGKLPPPDVNGVHYLKVPVTLAP